MKRSVSREYNQLQEKLTGYVAMLNFRFMNLCIKAEEASLLPVSVIIGGTSKKLEEVAVIAKKDDYRFVADRNILRFSIGLKRKRCATKSTPLTSANKDPCQCVTRCANAWQRVRNGS